MKLYAEEKRKNDGMYNAAKDEKTEEVRKSLNCMATCVCVLLQTASVRVRF